MINKSFFLYLGACWHHRKRLVTHSWFSWVSLLLNWVFNSKWTLLYYCPPKMEHHITDTLKSLASHAELHSEKRSSFCVRERAEKCFQSRRCTVKQLLILNSQIQRNVEYMEEIRCVKEKRKCWDTKNI